MKTIQIKIKYYDKFDDSKTVTAVVQIKSNHELNDSVFLNAEQFLKTEFHQQYMTDDEYQNKQLELKAKEKAQKIINKNKKEQEKEKKLKDKNEKKALLAEEKKSKKYEL